MRPTRSAGHRGRGRRPAGRARAARRRKRRRFPAWRWKPGCPAAQERADGGGSAEGERQRPVGLGASSQMDAEGDEAGEADHGERGRDRPAQRQAEQRGQGGDDQEAAADAEEAGHRTDGQAAEAGARKLGPGAVRERSVVLIDVLDPAGEGHPGRGQHHRHEGEDQGPRADRGAGDRADVGPRRRRTGECRGHPPADPTLGRMRPSPRRGAEGDDDQRRGRGRADALAEDIDEHRQRQDRATAADRPDHEADPEPEPDREDDLHQLIVAKRVRAEGLEPPRAEAHQDLNLARLPNSATPAWPAPRGLNARPTTPRRPQIL